MTKQALFLALVSSLLVAASGCGVVHALVCDPFGTGYRAPCEPCHNGVACGGATCQGDCDAPMCRHPVRNWLAGDRPCGYPGACGATCGGACGEPCGTCGEPCGACGECAESCDGCGCHHCRPFAWFLGLFHPTRYGCGGCGERYWGEWVNDRPDCHDPCDCHGNFIAGSHGFAGYGPNGPPMSASSATGRCRDCENNQAAQVYRTVPRQQRSYANSDIPGATRIISETDRVVVPAEGQPAPQMVQSLNRATSQ